MGFPPKIKENLFVACNRYCCICHKFAGMKMEVHHIIPAAKGGPDTEENGIPLCFDCHAEVGSYDPKHPKGNKFSSSELRRHKEQWFEKCDQVPWGTNSFDQNLKRDDLSNTHEFYSNSPPNLNFNLNQIPDDQVADLNKAKSLINSNKPQEAFDFLEKLKDKIWLNSKDIVKNRIFTYMGFSKMKLLENQEAGRYLIRAFQYDSDEEESIFNRAFGHLLINQKKEAKKYANNVLKKNPANLNAISIIIQSSDKESYEDIINNIDEEFRELKEITHAIGILARNRGDFEEAEKWLKKSFDENGKNSADLKGNLGEVILESILKDPKSVQTNQLSDSKKIRLEEAKNLLNDAWKSVTDLKCKESRISWIVNLSTIRRFLGDYDGAFEDINTALKYKQSALFKKNKALILIEKGDYGGAKIILEEILDDNKVPDAHILLANLLKIENEYQDSINTLNLFLKTDTKDALVKEAQKLLIELYIIFKDANNALRVHNDLFGQNNNDLMALIYESHIEQLNEDENKAISLLEQAKKQISDSSDLMALMMLADDFYDRGMLKDAAEVYKKFVDVKLNTNFTRKIIECYYRSGEIGEALKMCQTLREKYGPLEYVSEIEIAIYTEIYDTDKAKSLNDQFLDVFPSNLEMKIHQAIINLHLNNFEEVDQFLNSKINLDDLSLEQFQKLAYLYHFRGLAEQDYIDILYEMRRKYFNEDEAHSEYVKSLLFKDVGPKFTPIQVLSGMAVCLKNKSNEKEWLVLVNREDIDRKLGEIGSNDPIAQKILNKYVGEVVSIGEGLTSLELEIVKIEHKEVHALKRSMEIIKYSSKDLGLYQIELDPDEDKKFEPIIDILKERSNHIYKTEKLFKEKLIPVGTFAKFIGSNLIDAWNGIVNNPNLSLKCYSGDNDEKNNISLLKNKLVIDIVSLLTIHETNVKDNIVKSFGKLGIAQTTVDEIIRALNEQKNLKERGSFHSSVSNDDLVIQDRSENIGSNINYLKDLLEWIKDNCEIIPCRAALSMNRKKRAKFSDMFGNSFMDTILIASEEGNLLYSDDGVLRLLAKDLGVDGVWTQAVLLECLKKGDIDLKSYNEAIVKLLFFDYNVTNYGADILLAAAEESGWMPFKPYARIIDVVSRENKQLNKIKILDSHNSLEDILKINDESDRIVSLIKVFYEFIFKLSHQKISDEQKIFLINYLLVKVSQRDDGYVILRQLCFIFSTSIKKKYESFIKNKSN